jgi:hypothetical protein
VTHPDSLADSGRKVLNTRKTVELEALKSTRQHKKKHSQAQPWFPGRAG